MEENMGVENREVKKEEKMDWSPMILFYAKTTSWIVFPLIIAIIINRLVNTNLLLLFMILAFGITCFGIYREIKIYSKKIDK